MTRARLPSRRPNESASLIVGGQRFEACVGFDPKTDRPAEVFLTGGKHGSDFDSILSDAAIVISLALQHGVAPVDLAEAVGRAPDFTTRPGSHEQLGAGTTPSSPIGAALDFLLRMEPRVACKGASEHDHR